MSENNLSRLPTSAPGVLSESGRGVRFIEDCDDVVDNLNQLAEFGIIDPETAHRVARDLRGVVRACFAVKLH